MNAVDKITRRPHSYCPVLKGYQVCLIPFVEWEDAAIGDTHFFTDEQFKERFEKIRR